MSWIEELYKTYENCYGKEESIPIDGKKAKKPLLPPFHTLQNSHIEIRIDGCGTFIGAERIYPEEIIMPCTEKSSSAKTGSSPPSHPFCEMIKYCAGDYSGGKNSYFKNYYSQLSAWYNSDYKHPFVSAVYNYTIKKRIVADLNSLGKAVFKPDEEIGDLMVRWKVEIPGENETRCWKNHSLFDCWQKYCEAQASVNGICMVTGDRKPLAFNHPKRIRHSGDGGKLISSNDKNGFTFRGRFLTDIITIDGKKEEVAIQPVSISVEVSQKAHSALSWLIDRQSFRNGNQVIVSWAVSGKTTPDLLSDSLSLFDESDEEKIKEAIQISYNEAGQTFARKLNSKITGYKVELNDSAKIVVMGLDSAGPGRVSITYYRELSDSEFLERLENWHSQMAWFFLEFFQDITDKKKKHSGYMVLAPAPRTIAEACYGKRLDDKLKKSTIERLLPCIVDGRQIPVDIVESAVRRASNKISMDHWEWERTLSVACALYRCHSIRISQNVIKNVNTMALDQTRTDRDYLYGRLLAIAEYLEERALFVASEKRETNAARLMQRFSEQPYHTWKNIWESLNPSMSRLQSKRPGFLYNMKNLVGQIHEMFLDGDFEKDLRLSGLYLLGYHCQRLELNQKNDKEDKEHKPEN